MNMGPELSARATAENDRVRERLIAALGINQCPTCGSHKWAAKGSPETLSSVAEGSGMSLSTVSRFLHGRRLNRANLAALEAHLAARDAA